MMDSTRAIKKLSQQTLENVKQAPATALMNHKNEKKNVESASGNIDSSRDEVKAVEAQLKEAEGRLMVIDVDVLSPAAASPKQRKISVLPTKGIHTAVPQMIAAPAAATAVQSSRGIGDIMGEASVSNDAAATGASNCNDSGSLEVIVVEGCELQEVNGTFRRRSQNDGTHFYVKSGQWKGEDSSFEIQHCLVRCDWWIYSKENDIDL